MGAYYDLTLYSHAIQSFMIIGSITDKALRRFAETGNAKGVMQPERITDMLAFIVSASVFADLSTPPNFGLHRLKGNRADVWAMTVTRNYRLTFTQIDDQTIGNLNLEDYH